MKTVLYWDNDDTRIRRVLESFSGAVPVTCMASLVELRSTASRNKPAAIILGSSIQIEGYLVSNIEPCKNPSPPQVFVLTEKIVSIRTEWSCIHYVLMPQQLGKLVSEVQMLVEAPQSRTSGTPSLQQNSMQQNSIFVGKSAAIREVSEKILKYADSPHPVLLLGETGTGKELAARALHSLSSRKSKELVALNCSALPETLIESELFGAEKGAYTDAVTRKGAIGRASEGTLFLDEIGSMSQSAQPRLLRVVETGEYYPLGAEKPQKSNFRLVSASCKNPVDMAKEGQFRPDLLFRISDLIIFIPPLRERKEDIPLLADHFCKLAGKGVCELSPQAMEKLLSFSWPGNVRELKSVITRACVNVQSGIIRAGDISFISDFHDIFRPLAG